MTYVQIETHYIIIYIYIHVITSVLGFKIFNNFNSKLQNVPVKFFTPLQPSVQFLGPRGNSQGAVCGKVFGCDFFRCHPSKTSCHTWVWHLLEYFFRWHGSTTCMARLYNMWCFMVERAEQLDTGDEALMPLIETTSRFHALNMKSSANNGWQSKNF